MDFLEGIKKKLMEGSIDIDPKVTKLVNDNFWELAEGVKMGEKMTEEEYEKKKVESLEQLIELMYGQYQRLQDEYRHLTGRELIWLK